MDRLVDLLDVAGAAWWRWVFHATWQASLLALVVVLVVRGGRRWPSPLRYWILILSLAKFMAPPTVDLPTGVFSRTGPVVGIPSEGGDPIARVQVPATVAPPGSPSETIHSQAKSPLPSDLKGETSTPPAWGPDHERRALGWTGWLLLAHVAGSIALGTLVTIRWLRLRRFSRRAWPVREGPVHEAFLDACRQLGMTRVPRLLLTAEPVPPLAAGIRSPFVMVPASLVGSVSAGELRTLLAHEIAHHRRGDLWAIGIQAALTLVWWFNPAFWILSRAIDRTREECCDDLVIQRGVASAPAYCESLLRAAAGLLAFRPRLTILGAGLHPLGSRLVRVLDASLKRASRLSLLQGALILFLAAALLPGLRTAGDSPRPGESLSGMEERSLDFHAVNRRTGKPLAQVAVRTWSPPGFSARDRGFTGADGRLRIPLTSEDLEFLGLVAHKEGFVPTTVLCEGRREGKEVPSGHRLALEEATAIGGFIMDEEGKPISKARVHVTVLSASDGIEYERPEVHDHPVETGPDGSWRCSLLPASPPGIQLRVVHPDFRLELFRFKSTEDLAPLRSFTDRRTLSRGITIEGAVLDGAAQPVAGAEVRQRAPSFKLPTGHVVGALPSVTSGPDGRFRFGNGREGTGTLLLTVEAAGRAPSVREIQVAPALAPVEFRLEPARALRARVVDGAGRPIARAQAEIETWRGFRSLDRQFETDAEGRFVWENAPGDTVFFAIRAEGYRERKQHPLRAGKTEETIRLERILEVRGEAVDARTGRRIKQFRIVRGNARSASFQPRWEKSSLPFKEGRYRVSFPSPEPYHYLRFEADGHLPFVTRTFQAEEEAVTQDVRLEVAAGLEGAVLSPEGQPLAGVDVLLSTPSARVVVEDGRRVKERGVASVHSGPGGRFSLPPPGEPSVVVALHDLGYAEAAGDALPGSSEVRLEAWGRVEGEIKLGGRPGSGEGVHLEREREGLHAAAPAIHFKAPADASGRFTFDRVPPGRWLAVRQVALPGAPGPGWEEGSHGTPVEVSPGGTSRVTIGGGGRALAGRLVVSPGNDSPAEWASGDVRLARKARDRTSPAFYFVPIGADGSFQLEGVAPGPHTLTATLWGPPPAPGRRGDKVGSLSREVEVPTPPRADEADRPVDLGLLAIDVRRPLAEGDLAPPFALETLAGSRMDLEKLRGKPVVLHFWASWCGPCRHESPELKKLYQDFGKDGRVALIGVNLDDDRAAARKFVEAEGWGWVQAAAGPWSQSLAAREYFVHSIPHAVLIGADGRIRARRVLSAGHLLSQIAVEMEKP